MTLARVIDENVLVKSLQHVAGDTIDEGLCCWQIIDSAAHGPCLWVLTARILELYSNKLHRWGWRRSTASMQLSIVCRNAWYASNIVRLIDPEPATHAGSYKDDDAPIVGAACVAAEVADADRSELVTTDQPLAAALVSDGIPERCGFRISEPCAAAARRECGEGLL